MKYSKALRRLAVMTGTAFVGVLFFIVINRMLGFRFAIAGSMLFVLSAVMVRAELAGVRRSSKPRRDVLAEKEYWDIHGG